MKHTDGTEAKAVLKLHVALSLCKMPEQWKLTAVNKVKDTQRNFIFYNISMLSSMCKNYFGIMAMLKRGIACLSILKLDYTSFIFAEAILKLSVVSRNTRTQIFKKLFDFIESNCCRTSPSKRDLRLLKDLPSLIKKIVSMNNIRVVKNA